MGYRVFHSGIGRSADCPDVLLGKLVETIEPVHRMTGRRVRIIGHSRGGPRSSGPPLALGLARLAGGIVPSPRPIPRPHGDHAHNGGCACDLMDALAQPLPGSIVRAAIFSRDDGMVDWQSCLDDIAACNVEVHGSHVGLIVNAEVYMVLADLLASLDAKGRTKSKGA